MSCEISVEFERDGYGYCAYCPELDGYHSQGDSIQEMIENIREAIDLYIETMSDTAMQ
ncbi:MAG: type II toxin-antitoxin system HicB family antitoxin [Candidatus Coatesbacteria bacterium]|nr:type II toxin-antitoxin system HicB family antitoxin [Candidatus Coatesbacteria bacterium]